jgi:hypothetical protein
MIVNVADGPGIEADRNPLTCGAHGNLRQAFARESGCRCLQVFVESVA